MSYLFQNATAFDPYTGQGVPNASGQVFAMSDTAFATPLTVILLSSGLQTTELVSDQYSQLPGFDAGDNVQVRFRSGEFTKVLNTSTPLVGPQGATGKSAFEVAVEGGYAGTEAEYNATLTDAPNLVARAETAETAAADAANLVGAPADTAIATAINGPGTFTATALSAAIGESVPVSALTKGAYTAASIHAAVVESLTKFPGTTGNNRTVYLPAGDYLVPANFFSDWDFTSYGLSGGIINGLRFIGDGKNSTRIVLQTEGQESWLYDNKSVSSRMFQDLLFEGITFTADDTELGNGFKQWSNGGDKRFRFNNCQFKLYTVLRTEGTGNADLNRFNNCMISAHGPLIILNNTQSVANGFSGCDMNLSKSLVEVHKGGSLWVSMGNIEMHNDVDTSDHYLIDNPVPSTNGQGNAEFNLTDVRFEIHGANKRLVRTVGDSGMMQFNFTRAEFGTVSGGIREVAIVTGGKRLHFENCITHSNFEYSAVTTTTNNPMGSLISFHQCDTGYGSPLYSRCTTSGAQARIIAESCFRQSAAMSNPNREPEDFDYGWRTAPARAPLPKVKLINIKSPAQGLPLPEDDLTNLSVTLPSDAWIKRVYIKKEGLTAVDSSTYRLHFGTKDKTITLVSTDAASIWSDEQVIDVSDMGLTPSVLTIWATGTSIKRWSGGVGTVAYIEYI